MKSNNRDNYYGSVLDPLHGDIKLSEIEKWCISQPIFSRLRKVKQNTFLYYVFPSANHTRFEHSIGVMHLAGKIFDACKENYATGQKKNEKYSLNGISSFFDLDNLKIEEEVYYQELRLAALLHDVGHGPLSHLFDEFTISKERFFEIIKQDEILKNYHAGFSTLLEKKSNVEHEIISCVFIFNLIDRLKRESITNPYKFSDSVKRIVESISAERIVKLVEHDFSDLPDFLDSKGVNYTKFFSRIITAFPIDADRMDYLLRDSYFTGVTYGIYDINRIFSSFLPTLQDNFVDLTYKESGLDSMLRFIQSRSHLYNQVYFHKTNRAANTMLKYGTTNSRLEGKKLLDGCVDIKQLEDFYITNSDEYFLQNTVKNIICSGANEVEVINELIERKLFKRVFQYRIILNQRPFESAEIEIKKIKDIINEKLVKLEEEGIFANVDMFENKTFKDGVEKSLLIATKTSRSYTFTTDWPTVSKEFSLADMNIVMIRIFIRRTFTNSNEFEMNKSKVLNAVKNEIESLKSF